MYLLLSRFVHVLCAALTSHMPRLLSCQTCCPARAQRTCTDSAQHTCTDSADAVGTQMDVRTMTYGDALYDVVIDKAALDSMLVRCPAHRSVCL